MNSKEIKLFRAYRFSYMIGKPMVEDEVYEIMRIKMEEECPEIPELSRVYENDGVNREELIYCGVSEYDIDEYLSKKKVSQTYEFQESIYLVDQDNKSIRSYRTELEVINAFSGLGIGTYYATPKVDGIFVSVIYEKDKEGYKFKSAQSRGGSTDAVDVSINVKHMLPELLEIESEEDKAIKFNFEAIMAPELVSSSEYVNQRTGAQGVIMATVNTKQSQYHKIQLFCHGVSSGNTLEDKYSIIESTGLNKVPVMRLTIDSVTQYQILLEEFVHFVKEWSSSSGVEVDGVVVKKEGSLMAGEEIVGTKLYDADTFAIKAGFWSKEDIEVEVIGFEAETASSEISYGILFNPAKVSNGSTMTRVTNIRLATLMSQGIKKGDKIMVGYENGTTPKFKGKVGYKC